MTDEDEALAAKLRKDHGACAHNLREAADAIDRLRRSAGKCGGCEETKAKLRRVQKLREEEDAQSERISGLLADVCDAAFRDPERALVHGYDGILARVKALARAERRRRRARK